MKWNHCDLRHNVHRGTGPAITVTPPLWFFSPRGQRPLSNSSGLHTHSDCTTDVQHIRHNGWDTTESFSAQKSSQKLRRDTAQWLCNHFCTDKLSVVSQPLFKTWCISGVQWGQTYCLNNYFHSAPFRTDRDPWPLSTVGQFPNCLDSVGKLFPAIYSSAYWMKKRVYGATSCKKI